MRVKELWNFIKERHLIYERRQKGLPWPWTTDPILQKYRFCNIYRELDRVTIWIRENWREPNDSDPDLWFAMTVARMFNLPSTLEAIGYPSPYNPERIRKVVRSLQDNHSTVFNAAYMVRCDCQVTGKSKTDYLLDKVFTPMYKQRGEVTKLIKERSLTKIHYRLQEFYGMGSFMAAQVIADAKFHGEMHKAEDWWTFAAPGPGSMRGMSWVFAGDATHKYSVAEWSRKLHWLRLQLNPLIQEAFMPRLSAADCQNSLCEFSGYCKVKYLGQRKKQLYPRG